MPELIETEELQRLARRQLADYYARTPGRMFAESGHGLDLAAAYRLQIETARLRREVHGEAVMGYKIGCVSPSVQRQLGVEHPVFGHVFASEGWLDGTSLSPAAFCRLGIEGEFAVTLAADIAEPAVLRDRPERFVERVFPVIELHNHVLRGTEPSAVEVVANNALHAGIVLPERKVPPTGGQTLEIQVWINDERQGRATVDPLATLPALAERLAVQGIHLRQGDLALTGSPLPIYDVGPGDAIRVEAPQIGTVRAFVGD